MAVPSSSASSADSGDEARAWALGALGGADATSVPPAVWVARVREIAGRVRRARPRLTADLASFFERLGSLLPGDETRGAICDEICVEDLYLAHATHLRDPRAIAELEREIAPELSAALAKLRIPGHEHDDLRQRLWEKLLVGGGRPRILEYSGRGKLRFWFRVTAMRFLLDELRRRKAAGGVASDDQVDAVASPEADPELELLKRKYSHEFTQAFEQAAAALSSEHRNVLRGYYTKQMTVDEIAAAFGIHRATAARRVDRARQELLADTRRRLSESLRLNAKELESVLRLIESRMHVSVNRLLG